MNNTYIPFATNAKSNIIGTFIGNIIGWIGYEYSKKIIDSNFKNTEYKILKYKRI